MGYVTIDAAYSSELDNIEFIDTAEGKVKITDKKLIIRRLDKEDFLNLSGADFTVGVKMTAIKRVFEKKSDKEFEVRAIPEMFGNYVQLTEDASMKDMHEAIEHCINVCIAEIRKQFGQPDEA